MNRLAHVPPPVSPAGLALPFDVLGQLMPMYLWLDGRGQIRAMGPTLQKIIGIEAHGASFSRHFALRRSRGLGAGQPALAGGQRLVLTLMRHPAFSLRGLAVDLGTPAPGTSPDLLLNLSFGIQLAEAVRFFGLTEADFAASDLVMEFLFLTEAKAAVLSELRALTGRLEEARRAAETEALSDPLTGLPNRRAFDAALRHALKVAARGRRNFALLHLDLDYFKQVNDTLGHAAGDLALLRAAHALRDEVRRGDLVARVGGDEFMILLRGPVEPSMIEALARRLIGRIEEPMPIDGVTCQISVSIGVTIAPENRPIDAPALLAAADMALYDSKRAGKGCWTFAPSLPADPPAG